MAQRVQAGDRGGLGLLALPVEGKQKSATLGGMTSTDSPPIAARLKQIAAARDRHKAALNLANTKLAEAVRTAFAQGWDAPSIGHAVGLSPERCYQLRDGRLR